MSRSMGLGTCWVGVGGVGVGVGGSWDTCSSGDAVPLLDLFRVVVIYSVYGV